MRLNGRVSVIAGGAGGIGSSIATRFANEGSHVIVADRDAAGAEAVATRIGGTPVTVDVTRTDSVDALVENVLQAHGRVDALVNCAGIGRVGSVFDTTPASWDETISVNLTAVFLLGRRIAIEMAKARSGKIINVASITGIVGYAGRVAYCVSKAGVVMLTKAMALDCAPFNVQVNAICPGVVRTPMTEAALSDPAFLTQKLADVPLGRLGKPEDMAAAAAYLASSDADFVTGHALIVDGGMSVD
jgi:meso-butanediol dehydrogenase / (S,S)-butanediol dehydrogenase / diacetyl reductase